MGADEDELYFQAGKGYSMLICFRIYEKGGR